MEEIRDKGKIILKTVLSKEQNVNIFEKNIYDSTLKNLKKYENFDDMYIFNIYQTIVNINKKNLSLQELIKIIKDNKLTWNSEHYKNIYEKEIEQDNFLIKPFEIEEGVLECKCGSKRVYSYSKQSRSADEPMSTYATCMSCKNKWVYSG
jgi:DNA-directed RNA polymerase subunit M/transcription elongation factor TFIIS